MYTNVEALNALLIELFAPQALVPELLLRQMPYSLRTLSNPGAKVTVKRIAQRYCCPNVQQQCCSCAPEAHSPVCGIISLPAHTTCGLHRAFS